MAQMLENLESSSLKVTASRTISIETSREMAEHNLRASAMTVQPIGYVHQLLNEIFLSSFSRIQFGFDLPFIAPFETDRFAAWHDPPEKIKSLFCYGGTAAGQPFQS